MLNTRQGPGGAFPARAGGQTRLSAAHEAGASTIAEPPDRASGRMSADFWPKTAASRPSKPPPAQPSPAARSSSAAASYLNSRIIIGECSWNGGPQGLLARTLSSADPDATWAFPSAASRPARPRAWTEAHHRLFQDGTAARRRTHHALLLHDRRRRAEKPRHVLSDLYQRRNAPHHPAKTSTARPMYAGTIHGTGARYCPSIEDKIVRFKDKERHPIFLEPEGLYTVEWYVQGYVHLHAGGRAARHAAPFPACDTRALLRLAYAIEYECIDPLQLARRPSPAQHIAGLYFAGQINGTSRLRGSRRAGHLRGHQRRALLCRAARPYSRPRRTPISACWWTI